MFIKNGFFFKTQIKQSQLVYHRLTIEYVKLDAVWSSSNPQLLTSFVDWMLFYLPFIHSPFEMCILIEKTDETSLVYRFALISLYFIEYFIFQIYSHDLSFSQLKTKI